MPATTTNYLNMMLTCSIYESITIELVNLLKGVSSERLSCDQYSSSSTPSNEPPVERKNKLVPVRFDPIRPGLKPNKGKPHRRACGTKKVLGPSYPSGLGGEHHFPTRALKAPKKSFGPPRRHRICQENAHHQQPDNNLLAGQPKIRLRCVGLIVRFKSVFRFQMNKSVTGVANHTNK